MVIEICSHLKARQHSILSRNLVYSLSILTLQRQDLIKWIFEEHLKNPCLSLKESVPKRQSCDSAWTQKEISKSPRASLHDHILWQISLQKFTPHELGCIRVILQYLDENGILTENLQWIYEHHNIEKTDAEFALEEIQKCDPPGIGALHIQDSLLLQLKRIEIKPQEVKKILEEHWDDFKHQNFSKIAKLERMNLDRVKSCVQFVRKYLNLYPAQQFGETYHPILKPDIYTFQRDGVWTCSLNHQGLPRIRISKKWENLLNELHTQKNQHTKSIEFLKNQIKSAKWVLNCLDMRNQTILKVSEAILSHQKDFFDKGTSYLVKMTLKDLSEKLKMHESTISRAITNKCLFSPQGLFEFKYFFSSGLVKSTGEQVSSKSLKHWILEYLQQEENKSKPLSDQILSDLIRKEKNVSISRRTVAKYREELGIPPASKRKSKL